MTYEEFLGHLHELSHRRKGRITFCVRPWGGIRTAETIHVSRQVGPRYCGLPPISAVACFALAQPFRAMCEIDIGERLLGLPRRVAANIHHASYDLRGDGNHCMLTTRAEDRTELLKACNIRTLKRDPYAWGQDFGTRFRASTRHIENLYRNGWEWPLRLYNGKQLPCRDYAAAAALGRTHDKQELWQFYGDLTQAGWHPQLRLTDRDGIGKKKGAMYKLEIVVSCFRHKGDGPGELIVPMMHVTKKNVGIAKALNYVVDEVALRDIPGVPLSLQKRLAKQPGAEALRHLDLGAPGE